MPASFEIQSAAGAYKVEIAPGLVRQFLHAEKQVIVICDQRFAPELLSAGVRVIPLETDEKAKSLDAIPSVIAALRQAQATRDTVFLALGGGVIQDIAAFCAAIYMRGVRWIYAPTTLLGMADSCIGGKSSINVGSYKNLVGTFNPPQRVLIDSDYAATLSVGQMAAGLVEAAKICFCRGGTAWDAYLAGKPSVTMGQEALVPVMTASLTAKKWFIEIDEFDRKERLVLNFGHTFGHALEGASHFRISHGVAVGVGMLCALALGERLGRAYAAAPQVGVLRQHIRDLLASVPELPQDLAAVDVHDLFDRFTADKKHTADSYRVVLVRADGRVELVDLPKNQASRQNIMDAAREIIENLTLSR